MKKFQQIINLAAMSISIGGMSNPSVTGVGLYISIVLLLVASYNMLCGWLK